ncbi:hypothetical protein ENBRE01_0388 [Enteropsectra breve]|nr:hypothetical protein ENBRE01_0388 [Enteropsectra breve]
MKTLASAYVNLLKTSIGSGVLSFPFLFKTYGIIMTVFLTILSGFFAATGLLLLTICAQSQGRAADLSSLAEVSMHHGKFLVDIAVFVKCFGVSISYVIIVKQLLPQTIDTLFHHKTFIGRPAVCLFFFILTISPFAFLRRMDKLKYTSFLGVFCIFVVILASVYRYTNTPSASPDIRLFVPYSAAWIGGLGKFVFSFTCHQNIFAVNSEMENNSLGRIKRLICYVASSALVLYMAFGSTNYLMYGSLVSDNVLNNYPQDYLATIVRSLYVIVMGVSYPLQIAPARNYLCNMLGITTKSRHFKYTNLFLTTGLISITYLVAISGVQLGLVYTLVGATASTFMCLVLPAFFYMNMDVERSTALILIGYCAFLFGMLVFFTTICSVILKMH